MKVIFYYALLTGLILVLCRKISGLLCCIVSFGSHLKGFFASFEFIFECLFFNFDFVLLILVYLISYLEYYKVILYNFVFRRFVFSCVT